MGLVRASLGRAGRAEGGIVTRGAQFAEFCFSHLTARFAGRIFFRPAGCFFRPRWEPVRRLAHLPGVQPFERIL